MKIDLKKCIFTVCNMMNGKREAFKKRYRVVEETVRETHAKIYPWLLEAVTVEKATYKRLKELGMPCGKSIYYEARREFYKLLSEKNP